MNDSNYGEREIDIMKMLYKAFRMWRKIAIWAILLAFSAMVIRFLFGMVEVLDPEVVEDRINTYNAELSAHESEKRNVERSVESTTNLLEREQEYLADSIYINLDYTNYWTGSAYIYVVTDYQIIPGSTYQNENPAKRICQNYNAYISGGTIYRDVLDRLSYKTVEKYLKELLSVSVDIGNYAIYISALGDSEAEVRELISIAVSLIQNQYEHINAEVDEHTLNVIDNGYSTSVNYSLRDEQTNRTERLVNYNATILDLYGKKVELKEKDKEIEVPDLGFKDVAVSSVKFAIIAGIAVGFLGIISYCLIYAFSSNVQGSDSLPKDLPLLGEIPAERHVKKLCWLDRLFACWFGISLNCDDRDAITASTSAFVEVLVKDAAQGGKARIAVVSDAEDENVLNFIEKFASTMKENECVFVGNVATDPSALEKVISSDAVILLAEQDRSSTKMILKAEEMIKGCNVRILGTILFGVYAK